jgi:hypothetical protein
MGSARPNEMTDENGPGIARADGCGCLPLDWRSLAGVQKLNRPAISVFQRMEPLPWLRSALPPSKAMDEPALICGIVLMMMFGLT